MANTPARGGASSTGKSARPAPRNRAVSSPDPIAEPIQLEDLIVASPVPVPPSRRSARGTPTTKSTPISTPRKAALVRAGSTKKRTQPTEDDAQEVLADFEPEAGNSRSTRTTPAKRARNEPVSTSKAPLASSKGKGRAVEADPAPQASTPRRAQPARATHTPVRSARRTPASAVKAIPTPSRKSVAVEKPEVEIRHFDEAFADPAGSSSGAISREVFLANEALKRQREARNFRYEGDVDAPKLTRSGKVVGRAAEVEDEEQGEYGEEVDQDGMGAALEDEDGDVLDLLGESTPDILDPSLPAVNGNGDTHTTDPDAINIDTPLDPESTDTPIPLLPAARTHILNILSTLTSSPSAMSAPMIDEETNEALAGLINLLKGTVERGEGNSALLVGPRGSGKTRTMNRALQLLPSTSSTSPIIVRLSGHAQTNDRLAIREMGRQIAEAEGKVAEEVGEEEEGEGGENEEYAPTTLPSHLLALLTAPSKRAIVVVIEEFDLFTEHARQALLYCLLDVVQSINTGPVETTGRGVAVIGLTSRIDTLLLLEKRVKSRFSHRVWRTISPISPGAQGWRALLGAVLIPPISSGKGAATALVNGHGNGHVNGHAGGDGVDDGEEVGRWLRDWEFAVNALLDNAEVVKQLNRLVGLTTDVRVLYRPFIPLLAQIASNPEESYPTFRSLRHSLTSQLALAGWAHPPSLSPSTSSTGASSTAVSAHGKLAGLAQPELTILVIAKHLAYAGREEFNFAQVEEEYLRFARTRLVGSGRSRWPVVVLRVAFDKLLHLGLLIPTGHSNLKLQFAKVRCTLTAHEIVAWFKGEGAGLLSTELSNWGRMMGGHA